MEIIEIMIVSTCTAPTYQLSFASTACGGPTRTSNSTSGVHNVLSELASSALLPSRSREDHHPGYAGLKCRPGHRHTLPHTQQAENATTLTLQFTQS
jgi:hypothetical protein